MNMQDNDLDNLFRSKLEGFEVQPSARVWDEINNGLGKKQRRGTLAPLWSIAASVLVFIAAGVYFIARNNVGDNKKHGVESRRLTINRPVTPRQHPQQLIVKKDEVIAAVKNSVVKRPDGVKHQSVALQQPMDKPIETAAAVEAPVSTAQQPVALAAVPPTVIKAEVPDMQLAPKSIDIVMPGAPPVAIASAGANQRTKKRNVHTLGDLINSVVASVDKRKDKFIEFTNTDDDDESNITGINLGFIKVKKNK